MDFLKNYFVLKEIFDIEILEEYATLNKMVIGASTNDVNWQDLNTVFGYVILLLRYLVNKNKL